MTTATPMLGTEIELVDGLIGLPDHCKYSLVVGSREGFYWLQSLDEPTLGFVLVDPFPRFEGYTVDIGSAAQAELGPFDRSELLVLTVVTLGGCETEPVGTNLRGPIVFNLRTRRAKQLVVSDPDVELHAVFDPFSEIAAAV